MDVWDTMARIFKLLISFSFTVPRILVVSGYEKKTELWPKPDPQCALPDFPLEVSGAVGFWTAQRPTVCGGEERLKKCFTLKEHQ